MRRIYNFTPKKNTKVLDIDLSITEYTCGLFDFDWDMVKMILSAEGIYLVAMTQMNSY